MSDVQARPLDRIAVLGALLDRASKRSLGRTAVMKLMYLLQSVRGVPLGYSFNLFTYGPYDAQVLLDLDYASALGTVSVTSVPRKEGYGFSITPGPTAKKLLAKESDFASRFQADIDWVMKEFDGLKSSAYELVGTIVFVDCEWTRAGSQHSPAEMAERVGSIKPHFSQSQILGRVVDLEGRRILNSISSAGLPS